MPSGKSPNTSNEIRQDDPASRLDEAPHPEQAQPGDAVVAGSASSGETATETPSTEPKPRARRARRTKAKAAVARPIALPVLIVDETILLPHMSIPFPIEDEESSLVLDRAARLPLRQVLVLTEHIAATPPEGRLINDPNEIEALAARLAREVAPDARELLSDNGPDLAGNGGWTPEDEPLPEQFELCTVGVIAEVGPRVSRPGGHSHVILQGVGRGIVEEMIQTDPYPVARLRRHDDLPMEGAAAEAAMTTVLEQVESYLSMLPNVPEEVLLTIRGVNEPGWLADLIAFSPEFTPDQRQILLEVLDPIERLRTLGVLIEKRLSVLNLRQEIQHEAQAGMDRQQREYYLREQIRAIQKELGEGSPEETLVKEMRDKVELAGMPEEVKAKALFRSSGWSSSTRSRRSLASSGRTSSG